MIPLEKFYYHILDLIFKFTFPRDWIPLDKAIKTVAQDPNNAKTK
jgi:hypothetical protein